MQQTSEHVSVGAPAAKAGSALAAAGLAQVGIDGWEDAAACIACLYTLCLLIEFVWRKWTRPCLERRGWIKRRLRRRDDPRE